MIRKDIMPGRSKGERPRSSSAKSTMSTLLYPITVAAFIEKYFEQKPLYVKGSKRKFDHLFSADLFKNGLNDVSEIRAVFPGLYQAQIRPEDIKEMVGAGASICVTGMEFAHAPLLRATKEIRSELNYPGEVSFRAYLSPPGAGFDLHFDARVATTLQIMGEKRWWYSTEAVEPFPAQNSPRDRTILAKRYKIPEKSKLKSVLLRPGDLLCLPAGVWHEAEAGSTSLALNLAFDHFGVSVFDVIESELRETLQTDHRWRCPLPASQGDQVLIPDAAKNLLKKRLQELGNAIEHLQNSDVALASLWARGTGRPRNG